MLRFLGNEGHWAQRLIWPKMEHQVSHKNRIPPLSGNFHELLWGDGCTTHSYALESKKSLADSTHPPILSLQTLGTYCFLADFGRFSPNSQSSGRCMGWVGRVAKTFFGFWLNSAGCIRYTLKKHLKLCSDWTNRSGQRHNLEDFASRHEGISLQTCVPAKSGIFLAKCEIST